MKKICLLLIALMFLLTSCSKVTGIANNDAQVTSDIKVTNGTFRQVINALQHQDKTSLKSLFSNNVRGISNFDKNVQDLFDFFHGNVTSVVDTGGVGKDSKFDHGKKRMDLQFAYDVKTSEQEYHVAVKECTEDTFDTNNVGVTSIYIINAKNWHEPYVYRGDGKWTPGIVIDQSKI